MKAHLALDLLILPVKEHNLPTVSELYKDQDGIELLVLPRSAYNSEDSYIIAQSKLLEIPIIKISYNGSKSIAFDASFYNQAGLSIETSWSHFPETKETANQRALYEKIVKHEPYCLVSNTGSVGDFDLDVKTDLPIYKISPGHTQNLLDWALIITKAQEVHCIDSSVIHLVDRIPTNASKLVYHDVGRGSKFHLKKNWERKSFMEKDGPKAALQQVFNNHFDALPDEHIFELSAINLHILNPIKSTPKVLRRSAERFIKKSIKKGWGRWRHVCHYSFESLVMELATLNKPLKILETGSSAHGTNSSRLFFEIINVLGGNFDTVDLNPEATQRVQTLLEQGFPHLAEKIRCHNGDSVEFINNAQGPLDVVYLDSYDLYPGIFQESEQHGLSEFKGVMNKLADVAYILIDDTPRTRNIFDKMNDAAFMLAVDEHLQRHGHLPGKGALILKLIENDTRFSVLYHEYQLLIKYKK